MTHIAVQYVKDGKAVDWMEHVSDDQCGTRPGATDQDSVAATDRPLAVKTHGSAATTFQVMTAVRS